MATQGVQAVTRALGVLGCFTSETPTRALKDIAETTGLTVSTAHRMVKGLQAAGFLVQDSYSGKYSLGPAIMGLAGVILQRTDHDELVAIALPHMDQLRTDSGETVGIHVVIGDERICLFEMVCRQPMRMASGIGQAYPLHTGAVGKLLLSELPESRLAAYLDRTLEAFTARTLTRRDDLSRELDRIRAAGFATSVGETVEGASALAVPVLDSARRFAAAINVTGPEARLSLEHMRKVLPGALDVAEEISRQLGFDGPMPWGASDDAVALLGSDR